MGFLKISTSFLTRLAAETYIADRELLYIAVNMEEFLKLRGRTRLPVIFNRDEKHLNLNKQK
jgi:hypothetical protein